MHFTPPTLNAIGQVCPNIFKNILCNLFSKKRGLSALLIAVLICHVAFGQTEDPTNYIRTDLISASPTAQEMARYGDIPVTLYAGKTNLSVPLYSCMGTNLSHAISLNYNYSGFRPAQEASWVGLGWNLSVGGVITRTIKDKVDEDSNLSAGHQYEDIVDSILSMATNNQQFLDDAVQGSLSQTYDTEPDVYNFNFPGGSGKFIIVNDTFHIFPNKRYKIQGSPASGFTITTDDGIDYLFNVIEYTSLRGAAGANYTIPDYNSSFHLSKITHPTGEIMEFIYANQGTVVQYGTRTQTLKKSTTSSSQLQNPKTTYPTDVYNVRRLEWIKSDKCKVYFDPGSNRADVDGTQKALDEIIVFDHDSIKVKSFDLKTSYFGSTSNHQTCYLKLDWVKERGSNGLVMNDGYQFDYENELSTFPNALTAKIDHYGYLNGSGSFAFGNLIPVEFQGSEIGGSSLGVDREPNFSFAKYGALSKVTYPVDGFTEFEYELNDLNLPGNNTLINKVAEEDHEQEGTSGGKLFTITHDQDVTLHTMRLPKSGVSTNSTTDFEIRSYDPVFDEEPGAVVISFSNHPARNLDTITTNLPKGKYLFRVVVDTTEESLIAGELNYQSTNYVAEPGAGIRIKKVTSNPIIGLPIVKTYSYSDSYGKPTGSVHGFVYEQRSYLFQNDTQTDSYTNINSTAGMVHSPTLETFYKEVSEYQYSSSDTLKTTYQFQKLENVTNYNFLGAELEKRYDFKSKDGQYKVQKKVENTYAIYGGGVLRYGIKPYLSEIQDFPLQDLVEIFDYETYALSPEWYFLSRTVETMYEDGSTPLVTETTYDYDLDLRYLREQKSLQSDGSYYLSKFRYPEDFNSPTQILKNNHILSPVLEKQVWHLDGTDTTALSGVFSSYNSQGLPVAFRFLETDVGINSIAESADTLIVDNHYNQRVTMIYDSGRPVGQSKLPKSGIDTLSAPLEHEGILWGYDNNYPIAQVKNASSSTVFHTSFEDEDGETDLDSKSGGKLRKTDYTLNLTSLLAGDYYLSYWRRESGEWIFKRSLESVTTGFNTTITANSSEPIDEVRFHPVDALMTTYTYRPLVGIESATDETGRTSWYYYDEFSRLFYIKDEEGNITQSFEYHY